MAYQVRLSYETAVLLEEVKAAYEKRERKPVTKGEVLINAYYDSQWVENWQSVYEERIKILNEYDIKENALRPKLQITKEVEQGIKDLKIEIATELGLRSVTIGVVIKLILKASYIKNISEGKKLDSIFERYRLKVEQEFTGSERNKILELVKEIKKEIEELIG